MIIVSKRILFGCSLLQKVSPTSYTLYHKKDTECASGGTLVVTYETTSFKSRDEVRVKLHARSIRDSLAAITPYYLRI